LNAEAAAAILRLLTEPPREPPAEARAEADASQNRSMKLAFRTASLAYASALLYVPFGWWLGHRHMALGLATEIAWLACAALAYVLHRRAALGNGGLFAFYVMSALAVATSSLMMGSLFILPMMALANSIATVLVCPPRHRLFVLGAMVAAMFLPLGIELSGLVPTRYVFDAQGLTIAPLVLEFPPGPTIAFLAFVNLALLLTATLFVARQRDALTAAEQRLIVHSWQLRQLMPNVAHHDAASVPPAGEDMGCVIPHRAAR
jgi:hypothetical protein